jgi:glutamate 5-kinase
MRKEVSEIKDEELEIPHNPNHAFATGGIATKLKAAKFLLSRGKKMFMASGFELEDVRSFMLDGVHKRGTLFS